MTTEKLTESTELEDYCLLNGYSIVYNRWTDSLVFSRDGNDYIVKEEFSDDDVLKAIDGLPEGDPLYQFLEQYEPPADEIL